MYQNMEQFNYICQRFKYYLLFKGTSDRRVNFPRKHAIIFGAELIDVVCSIASSYKGQNDAKFNRCSRLSFALTVLAENCKGASGIEAFIEVLEVIVELFLEIKKNNQIIDGLIAQRNIFSATVSMLTIESNTKPQTDAIETVAAEDVIASSVNPLLENLDDLSEVLERRLEIIRVLICKNQLKYVKSVKSVRDHKIQIYHSNVFDSVDLMKELDSLKHFLDGFEVDYCHYSEPIEL